MAPSRTLARTAQMHHSQPHGYREIAAVMFAWVNDGRYRPGTQIPTESSLCEEFKVSRVTIRRAIAVLIEHGALQSRQGMGTFVSDNYTPPPANIQVKMLGPHTSQWLDGDVFRFLGSKISKPTSGDREFFGRALKSVEEFCYLRIRQNRPIEYFELKYPDWVTALIEDRTEAVMLHLNPYLAERGAKYQVARQSINVITADKHVARLLELEVNAPIVRARVTWWDEVNRPLMLGAWHHRADQYEMNLEMTTEYVNTVARSAKGTRVKLRSV